MTLGPEQIDHLALLARLDLSAGEKALMAEQLNRIVAAVEKLNELDLDSIEPLAQVVPARSVFRDDIPHVSLTRAQALACAPVKVVDGYVVPRVVGGEG